MKYLSIYFLLFSLTLSSQESQNDSVPKGWWKIPKTDAIITFGGYVKLDWIQDFNAIGSPYRFNVNTIPTDGSKGTRSTLNMRETRLHFDARKQVKGHAMRTYFEGDFYSTNGAFRIRHAFVDFDDKLLVGQYWSNFMDELIIPLTLDFEKPAAYVWKRNPMIRYQAHLSESSLIGIAIENPSAQGDQPAEPGTFENPVPDLTLKYRLKKNWGHVQLSGYTGLIRYRYDSGRISDIPIYGVNLSGNFKLFKRDYISYQALYGPGMNRYRGGISTTLDPDGSIAAIREIGGTICYSHYWSEKFSSLALFNTGHNLNVTVGQPENNPQITRYFAVNFLWHFLPKSFVGIEYLFGEKIDVRDREGHANRLQLSMRYTFN